MKKIFSVLLFMALFSSSVFGIKLSDYGLYPFQVETGTRPLSLSMAFSGLANDETSAFYNPGGLPWSKGIMLCIDNASNLAASQAYPTGFGSTFGISVVQTNLSSYEAPNSQIIDFSNNILFISLGSKLSAIPFMGPIPQSENIGLGINFKTILGQTLRPLGSFDRTAQGWELDFGALYKASPWLSMGLNAQNIMPQGTDMMSGGVIKWDDGTLENVPAVLNAGVSAKIIGDKNSPLYLEGNEARFNMDIHSQREIPSWGSFGIEWGYKGTLFARVGTFIKDGVKDAISTGFGLRFGGWGMDFSQSKSVITNENKMSISILYDPEEWVFEKKPEEKKAPKLEIKDPFIFLSPSYESSTYEDSITVYGRVQKGLGVAVNSQKIELTSLDEFSAYVPLNPGKNLILIDVTS